MTRDEKTAARMSVICRHLAELETTLSGYAAHADGAGAVAHAALYRVVADKLETARATAADACVIMSDGDPEDYLALSVADKLNYPQTGEAIAARLERRGR
jgi:hypothetical protein